MEKLGLSGEFREERFLRWLSQRRKLRRSESAAWDGPGPLEPLKGIDQLSEGGFGGGCPANELLGCHDV